MSTLPSDLRNKLERVVIEARDVAEIGARVALEALAVNHYEPYPHMKPVQRELRTHLRARARQLGDRKLPKADTSGKDHVIDHLVGECAYEHWHRMLFARFLAENNLLIEPEENMAISLTEAEELAAEAGVDVWMYASRCAQRMLPQIFRPDDPLLQVTFATEHMLKLERLLASLPGEVFTASDALGWVYQFWQSKKKDEVNRAEVKIGADEIAAVTQLFTEPYMVEFLIHNTLGAWWAGKKLDARDAANAKTENELRAKLALPGVTWDYLRFIKLPLPPGEGRGEGKKKRGLPEDILKNARDLRRNQTDAEQLMWALLRDRRLLNKKFRRQHPIDRYVLDFYCHDEKLAIELDGGQHNEEKNRHYDEKRAGFLAEQGIRILRFWNHQVLQETESVMQAVYDALQVEDPHPNPLPEGEGIWRPAAGTFDGWPKSAKDIKGLDPCCGSGHFLVALFRHLVPIRMAESGLSAREAVDAVLRDNIHGLEIDERCCQIAAFALALAAWTYPNLPSPSGRGAEGEGTLGYRPLPELHIACTGIGPQATEEQWLKLAEQSGMPIQADKRERVKNGLRNLHRLFSQAPTLGSLIDPKQLEAGVFAADYETIRPYLSAVLKAEKTDDETHEQAIAAAGMVKAADILAGEYTLVITNVPYLGRGNQNELLAGYCENHYYDARGDLATCFLERCIEFSTTAGAAAMVLPQNWLFLSKYKKLRPRLLKLHTWNVLACVGPRGFETISGEVVNVVLLSVQRCRPRAGHRLAGVDVTAGKTPNDKNVGLRTDAFSIIEQASQLDNPDSRIAISAIGRGPLLGTFAEGLHGQGTFDKECFTLKSWEISEFDRIWVPQQSTPQSNEHDDYGATQVFRWEDGTGLLFDLMEAKRAVGYTSGKWKAGVQIWGEEGVAVSGMGRLIVRPYLGKAFDENVAVVKPFTTDHLLPITAFCNSTDFEAAVKQIDRNLKASCNTLVKVPFDLAHWQKIATEKYPRGLPEPESDDPTQWLFHGRPDKAQAGTELQVAVARLLGYRWPAEDPHSGPLPEGEGGMGMRLSTRARAQVKRCEELAKFVDNDGIVCIPAVRGEDPAADRLLRLLDACGIPSTGSGQASHRDLDDWLRNGFFEEHCKLFHDRPFVWHIWDGRKRDGFHALVNYHKLAEGGGKGRRLLESLTYAYLGEWITRQKDDVKRGEGGSDDRLAAALELQKRLESILAGEPPFDIFVRWKPLHEQSIGWGPDINDGVRLNIRPFLASDLPSGKKGAGILRYKPNINWTKDRGKEPWRPKEEYPWFWGWDEKTTDFMGGKNFDGNRWNDCHYTNKTKQAACEAEGRGVKK